MKFIFKNLKDYFKNKNVYDLTRCNEYLLIKKQLKNN